MLRLIMGGKSNKEGVGTTDYGILVIDTDGSINKNDTLKVARKAADRFDRASWTISFGQLNGCCPKSRLLRLLSPTEANRI